MYGERKSSGENDGIISRNNGAGEKEKIGESGENRLAAA